MAFHIPRDILGQLQDLICDIVDFSPITVELNSVVAADVIVLIGASEILLGEGDQLGDGLDCLRDILLELPEVFVVGLGDEVRSSPAGRLHPSVDGLDHPETH